MSTREMICIVCPIGCRMTVETVEGRVPAVEGNQCSRGIDYAIRETTNPTRILPTTVKILNAPLKRLPVRTERVIPKSKIMACMKVIMAAEVTAPVKMGDVIIHDILQTGVDVIATRSMPALEYG